MYLYCSRRKQSEKDPEIDGNEILAETSDGVSLDLMCPVCFRKVNITMFTHCDITTDMIGGIRPPFTINEKVSSVRYIPNLFGQCQCGKTVNFMVIDPKISQIIVILNKKNWKTIFSCQGHIDYCEMKKGFVQPYIMFDPEIKDIEPLNAEIRKSKYWEFGETDFLAGVKVGLRPEYRVMKGLWDDALKELTTIAWNLPILVTKHNGETIRLNTIYPRGSDENE